jgi:hypothetical protein
MALAERIQEANQAFLQSLPRIARELAREAIAAESSSLPADAAMRAFVSLGEENAEGPDAEQLLRLCYDDRDDACVINLFQFLDQSYRRAAVRLGAFDYRRQEEMEDLQRRLAEDKEAALRKLSQSTVVSLESIMARDQAVLEAESKRDVEKRSFTDIRRIIRRAAQTERELASLEADRAVDVAGVYQALQEMRKRLNAHERQRQAVLREGQQRLAAYWEEFLAALQEPLACAATLGLVDLPNLEHVEELPITDWQALRQTVLRLLAADTTVAPQTSLTSNETYPMPRVVLAPATGFVAAATNLSVEKFRDNVIFFPVRCLEDAVRGLTRELLKLKRKMHPRREAVARDEYLAFVKGESLVGGGYEAMYETFLRFSLGDEECLRALTDDQRRILREHFLPRYTRHLFVPPPLRELLQKLPAGTPQARSLFNRIARERQEDLFFSGALYADRAEKYGRLIEEAEREGGHNAELLERHRNSRAKSLGAARRFFHKAYQAGELPRFALYNTAVLQTWEAADLPPGPEQDARREKAGFLFAKSREGAPRDLWNYYSCVLAAPPSPAPAAADPAAEAAPEDGGRKGSTTSVFDWLKQKLGGR